MFKVTIIGRLAEDIQIRQTGNTIIGTIKVISDNGYTDKNTGQWVSKLATNYITVFGNRAVALRNYIRKGHKVYLEAKAYQEQGQNGVWYTNYHLEELHRLTKTLAEMNQDNLPMNINPNDYTTAGESTQSHQKDDIPF